MDVILLQPNASEHPYRKGGLDYLDGDRVTPAWSLLTLQMYLRQRSMHHPTLFDARIEEDPYGAFVRRWRTLKDPAAVVIYADALHAADAMEWLIWLREKEPDLKLLACGPLVDVHSPALLGPGGFDFAARGDAEWVIRNALDHLDNPVRLQHLPGLCSPKSPNKPPYIADSLETIPLPDWSSVEISRYKEWFRSAIFETDLRMARGNSGLPPDRFFEGASLPWRTYPDEEILQSLQASSGSGASHAFLADGPAIWTPERLRTWCTLLMRKQTQQSWGFRLLPTFLEDEELEALELSLCRRIEFLLPSTDPDLLAGYGCIIDPAELRETIGKLHDIKVHVTLHFLLGHPEEPEGEGGRIVRILEALDGCDHELHPYPCWPDSPASREQYGEEQGQRLEAWIAELITDPERPAWWDWPDSGHVDRVLSEAAYVRRRTTITPMRSLKRSLSSGWRMMRHSLKGGGPAQRVNAGVNG